MATKLIAPTKLPDFKWLRVVLLAITSITVFCLYNPFAPVMPSNIALDPSWVIGLNQAVAQKLRFGEDIVFTFGPYAAIYTKAFHPATESRELFGSLYLAVLYTTALVLALRNAQAWIIIGFCLFLSGFTTHLDGAFFSYALLASIYCWHCMGAPKPMQAKIQWHVIVVLAILFSGFGLYPLIKGPHFILFLLITLFSIAAFLANRRWLEAATILLVTTSSLISFWLYADQDLFGLFNYFSSQIILTAGFAQAMSNPGNTWEVVSYITLSFALVLYVIKSCQFQSKDIYLVVCCLLYLFVAFKAGFTRHDGHALMGADALIIAALLIAATFPSRLVLIICAFTSLFFLAIEHHYQPNIWSSISGKAVKTYWQPWQALQDYSKYHQQTLAQFNSSLTTLSSDKPLPKLDGTSDIFPFDQTYLIASGNNWNPRPVFQSYHAYTKKLADLNLAFLGSPNAPDSLFFRIESIDERLPSGDDGTSWPVLLTRYQPSHFSGPYLILQKKSIPAHSTIETLITRKQYPVNTWVDIPGNQKMLYASIDLKPSLIGRIKNLLYQASPLGIAVQLEDGTKKQFRLVPGIASNRFLLSPFIENAVEFNELYQDPDLGALKHKRVTAISVWAEGNPRDWENSFELSLKEVK
jgi:hypothetical protein